MKNSDSTDTAQQNQIKIISKNNQDMIGKELSKLQQTVQQEQQQVAATNKQIKLFTTMSNATNQQINQSKNNNYKRTNKII
ncbi:hypothetical protein Glove_217g78 [Diversispora epigaea]|uniref:Uncharacterized protein n=1 Tax=Diversispora epigaea TaxID=1348612 RepID=A0A397IPG2_9GLOM|nr:hypothetical protein Glove_217g78 [Diversispora epigaea]